MKMLKSIAQLSAALIVAFGLTAPAAASAPASASIAPASAAAPAADWKTEYQGVYKEVNSKDDSYIYTVVIDEEGFHISVGGLYDIMVGRIASPAVVTTRGDGFSFDSELRPLPYMDGESIRAHVSFTGLPSDLYQVTVDMQGHPDEMLAALDGTFTLYKDNESHIVGTVPARIGSKVTIAGLIKAVSPYMFTPEMMATLMYLKDHSNISDCETITQDERNRYLQYAWGSEDRYMECKYWNTSDGNVLLVVNTHDGTYQYPQSLRFFLFDRAADSLTELPTAMSREWPLDDYSDNNGICYQVRYNSDGIVALVPQAHGDSFDIVTLKFDGKMFK